jgi:Fe-Mn family superoxide dismutase
MFQIGVIPFLLTGIPGFLSPHAVQVHVNKHHQAYVDFVNKALPQTDFVDATIERIIWESSGPLFNNAAQHYNHAFFWDCLSDGKVEMSEYVADFLIKNFGSVEAFKKEFVQKASTIFGSGWCYLSINENGTISINQYSNAGNPIKEGGHPLLCVDTWEHSWYIDYENKKVDYFERFWTAVNWEFVEKRLRIAYE